MRSFLVAIGLGPRARITAQIANAPDADNFQACGSGQSSFECIEHTDDMPMVTDKLAMAKASSTTSLMEPTARTSSKVTDWVQQQALEDRAPDVQDGVAVNTAKVSSSASSTSRKYAISTLLELRYTTNLAGVELRLHPSALQECIFRPAPFFAFPKPQKRARGLSDISINSLHSIPSEEEVIYRKIRPSRAPFAAPNSSSELVQLNFVNRFPRRQPCSPPATALAQQHDGFARFLKEHASPTHQRVTAGGRIVPASGPPPVFNVDSLRTPKPGSAVQEASKKSQEIREGLAGEDKSRRTATIGLNAGQPAIGRNVLPRSQNFAYAQQSYMAAANTGSNAKTSTAQSQLQAYLALQAPLDGASIALADGSNLVTQNGVSYRVYWNGFQTVSEPVFLPFAAMPGVMSTNFQPSGLTPQYSIANPYAANPVAAVSTGDNGQNTGVAQSDQRIPDHVLDRLHETLRYELKKLDKHIALRSNMFSALEHADHVTQRKNLVEQLDKVRISLGGRGQRSSSSSTTQYQGNLSANPQAHAYNAIAQEGMRKASNSKNFMTAGIPIKYDSQGLVTGPPWDELINGAPKASPAMITTMEQQQKTPPSKKGPGASSILSPDAPPFVPSSMQSSTARKVETCLSNYQRGNTASNAVTQPSTTIVAPLAYGNPLGKDVNPAAMAVDKDHQEKHSESQNLTVMARSRCASGSWSAMDDVIPFVHRADIAYVDNLGLNPVQGPKLYCSTVTEFQEVIRRVREQARLYGCEGGQSKDPEFDAEQDIRWAMADSSPVPLPNKMPDHIAYPRPWNWNDSAFNIRADRSVLKSKKTLAPIDLSKGQDRSGSSKNEKATDGVGLGETNMEANGQTANVAAEGPKGESPLQSSVNKASESKQFKAPDPSRSVLKELSPNNPAMATKHDNIVHDNKPRPLHDPDYYADPPARTWAHDLYEEKMADPKWRAELEASKASIAAFRGGNQSLHASHAKMGAAPSMVAEKMRSTSSASQMIGGARTVNQWNLEDKMRNNAVGVAYGDPLLQRSIPQGFGDLPLPPNVQSKAAFTSEESQKGAPRDPYVRFPDGQQYKTSQAGTNTTNYDAWGARPLGYNEHKPVSIPTGSMYTGSHSFLRDMLKTSRYSTAGPNQQRHPESNATQLKPSGAAAARYPWNKENFRTNMSPSHSTSYTSKRSSSANHGYFVSPDARLSKAQSSVAPSSHHAQGYLPQYPGHGNPPLSDYYIRAHTPQGNSRMPGGYSGASQSGFPSPSPRRYPPQYDGSGDASPPLNANGVEAVVSKKEAALGPQDFRSDSGKLPSGHSYAVDRLIETIRETERKEMDAYDQKPVKRT